MARCVAALFLFALGVPARADFLYGLSTSRELVKIDLDTYSVEVVGNLGKGAAVQGLFWGPANGLYAVGNKSAFYLLDQRTGRAKEIGIAWDPEVAQVAYDLTKNQYMGIASPSFCEVDPANGSVVRMFTGQSIYRHLFFVPEIGLVTSSQFGDLYRVDWDATFTFLVSPGVIYDSLAFDPVRRVVWGERNNRLVKLDPYNGWRETEVKRPFPTMWALAYSSPLPSRARK